VAWLICLTKAIKRIKDSTLVMRQIRNVLFSVQYTKAWTAFVSAHPVMCPQSLAYENTGKARIPMATMTPVIIIIIIIIKSTICQIFAKTFHNQIKIDILIRISICNMLQLATEIESIVSLVTHHPSKSVHRNAFITFWVILQKKQRKENITSCLRQRHNNNTFHSCWPGQVFHTYLD